MTAHRYGRRAGTVSARRHLGRQRGQATVELVGVVPVLMTVVLVVVQVGLVARDQVLVWHAARESVRALALDGAVDLRRAALDASVLDPSSLDVTGDRLGGVGGRARVRIRYRAPTLVPIVGALVPDVTLSARATARIEQ